MPDVAPAFEPLPTDPVERDEYEDVLGQIEDQLDRAATHAFSSSFFISALFALAGADSDWTDPEAGPVTGEEPTEALDGETPPTEKLPGKDGEAQRNSCPEEATHRPKDSPKAAMPLPKS